MLALTTWRRLALLQPLLQQAGPAGAALQAVLGRQAVAEHEQVFWGRISARRRQHQGDARQQPTARP
jgi:hypothetical protein